VKNPVSEVCFLKFNSRRYDAGLDKALKRLEPLKRKHPDVSWRGRCKLSSVRPRQPELESA
jgi:hypothetical protein